MRLKGSADRYILNIAAQEGAKRMSKKVYIGGGKYCYTDNCRQHDTSEAGQLTLRANDAAASGNVSDFLKYKEAAAEAERRTGAKSSTSLIYPSFSPDSASKPSPAPALRPTPKPAPPRTAPNPQSSAEQQQFRQLVSSDIRSYEPNETTRNGDGIVKFHKEIGFPLYFRQPKGSVELRYSRHALEEAENDRYGRIPVLERADFDNLEVIEVKYNQTTGRIDRMLYRQNQGEDNVCIVVSPGRGAWNVVTTWFNEANDSHKTLNRSNYSVPHTKEQILSSSAARKAA